MGSMTSPGPRPAAPDAQLEFRKPARDLVPALATFFAHLEASGESRRFHPHPFTAEEARERAEYRGRDVYCVAVAGGEVLGYGMLRGWDEGYAIPSLGIAIHASARGIGLGRAMMLYLQAEASRRGAARIRLKVYPDNAPAVRLYRSLGYEFSEVLEHGQLVGMLDLAPKER
jgi:ribosomal protein S18 acetylase RimI-like enzyme